MSPVGQRDLSGYAWLITILPALAYLFLSRTIFSSQPGGGGFGRNFPAISDRILDPSDNAKALGEIFHVVASGRGGFEGDGESGTGGDGTRTLRLSHPLELVLSGPPLRSLISLRWVHDPELGRGFLLLSDSGGSGRIWRWEVGGGPIAIGRSLHMEGSGCRSGIWGECVESGGARAARSDKPPPPGAGSAGLAIEFAKGAESHRTGKLVVAERGERRIARIEDDGARTPLVIEAPSLCRDDGSSDRIVGDGRVAYSHFGDLIFTDNVLCGSGDSERWRGGVYRLREAVHVPPVPAALSRAAHGWNATSGPESQDGTSVSVDHVELLFAGMERISDVALGGDPGALYVAGIMRDGQAAVLKLLLDDDEDEKNEGKENQSSKTKGLLKENAKIFYKLTDVAHQKYWAGPALAVDDTGNIFVGTSVGVTVLDKEGEVLGTLPLHDTSSVETKGPVSLELGDGYLFIATQMSLMRVRTKAKAARLATDMVVPPKKKTAAL